MFSCTTEKYDQLYAPWLARGNFDQLLKGIQPGDRVLDLCGGSG